LVCDQSVKVAMCAAHFVVWCFFPRVAVARIIREGRRFGVSDFEVWDLGFERGLGFRIVGMCASVVSRVVGGRILLAE